MATVPAGGSSLGVPGPALPAPTDLAELRARLGPPVPASRVGDLLVERGVLDAATLRRVLAEQRATGGRLGDMLVSQGLVHRLDLYRALSDAWGLPHVDLSAFELDHALCASLGLDPAMLASASWLPLAVWHGTLVVATAERPDAALVADVGAHAGGLAVSWLVTTDWDVRRCVLRSFGIELSRAAASRLAEQRPQESAARVLVPRQAGVLVGLGLGVAAALALEPRGALVTIFVLLNALVLANALFKALAVLCGYWLRARRGHVEPPAVPDAELPIYTVLVPAFGEANVIGELVAHLAALDYPRDRLEVLLLLEEVDRPTIEAALACELPAFVRIVVVPDGQPRTKPKACNVGLDFAHGELLVIYDAEDRPAPDQLRRAVAAFRAGPPELVCVQARLSYWNAFDNLLTRFFALEYAHWFDLMLDGLAALRLPIPLGGTSNHFRTAALRDLGGWDPHNVTEDADLGLRAAGRGLVVETLASTTLEEACSMTTPWIKQRTRWIKGYMQTALVHTRHPACFVRSAGLRGTLTLGFLVAGTPLAFLAAPVLWLALLVGLALGEAPGVNFGGGGAEVLAATSLVVGNLLMIGASVLAAVRRRSPALALWALALPAYWVLHSIAAWRAAAQLVTKPSHWEKTPHGLRRPHGAATGPPALPPLPARDGGEAGGRRAA